jgi:transcriptional regulator with XRE-family HTH domain
MREARSRTPGGARLRQVRQAAGRSQLWVEAEAELGTGYLQRVESGKVAQPERPTLERILAALGARYSERQEVLEFFGYTVATPPPTEEEIAWAANCSQPDLRAAVFPAYVLDCAHRLIAWNDYLPRLLGWEPADRRMSQLAHASMLAHWFDPASPLGALVVEPDVFLPAAIRALRYEMRRYRHEAWYRTMLAGLLDDLPRFRAAWARVAQEPEWASATRALVPLRLGVPGIGLVQFRLSTEPFTRDGRFRVVYLFPADVTTMRQCAAWTASAAGTAPPAAATAETQP